MIKADVIIDHCNWKRKIKNPNLYIKKKLNLLSKIYFFKKKTHNFTLFLTNNKNMKVLNNKFRKKNKITDVLSFPLQNKTSKKIYLGDVAISYEIIKKRAKNSNFFFEFDKIWVHGYLHLLGYDHKKNKDFKKMQKKENLILRKLYQKIDIFI